MAAHAPPRTTRRTADGGDARLPWWALTLPAVVFAALLSLLVGGEAQAAESPQYLGRLLEYFRHLLSG
ncbi:hypothetical protein F0L17_04685 [Streptomyces sp. TRM43335]|uniref:Uncharacterized protein n=1 Tax=Streptomyces taklimakanensis TaxID=2569853 RepID=A0A6G2B885_9ACTN|nr:hypothetical protein [Streptomyces taklimakanensis]MTE18434.1 hypothetical protein [Streptomyces taklimakanensis]